MTAEDLEISTLFGGHRPPLQGFRCVLVFCRPYGAVFVLPAPPRLTPWAKALSLASRAGSTAASEDPHAVRRRPQFIARFARGFNRGVRKSTRCPPWAPVLSLASRAVLAAERRQHIAHGASRG